MKSYLSIGITEKALYNMLKSAKKDVLGQVSKELDRKTHVEIIILLVKAGYTSRTTLYF